MEVRPWKEVRLWTEARRRSEDRRLSAAVDRVQLWEMTVCGQNPSEIKGLWTEVRRWTGTGAHPWGGGLMGPTSLAIF